MSVSSTTRKAGPYACNGVITQFAFAYKVFASSEVRVVQTNATGLETDLTLTTHYTVALNADQDANPGGTVTTLTAYATGNNITLTSKVENLQPVVLTNNGGFYPRVINDALDRLTILVQQTFESLSRSIRLPISTPSGVNNELPAPRANGFLRWNSTGTTLDYVDLISTEAASSALKADLANSTDAAKGAAQVGYKPTANISSTTVQGAINELDAEKLTAADFISDYVINGLVSPTSDDLNSTLAAGSAYVMGYRVTVSATPKLYTASKDTYVDLSNAGVLAYVEVANGAAAPGVTGNSLRLQKVITDATAITSVVQLAQTVLTANRPVATGKLPVITAAVASNNLTLGATALPLDFRSASLSDGAVSSLLAAPATIVVPSGATLGTVNAKLNRLIIGVMNVAGTAELFVVNSVSGNYLNETRLITTTILDAAADSTEVAYSATARTNVPFRLIGIVESTQATAGTWATAPSLIQGIGGLVSLMRQTSFRAYQSTAQSIAAATFTKLLFQTEDYDFINNFSGSSFTAPMPGTYVFSAAVNAIMAAGQRGLLVVYVNGSAHTRIVDTSPGAADTASLSGSGIVRLSAGDIVEIYVYYSVAEDTVIGSSATYFSGHRIG